MKNILDKIASIPGIEKLTEEDVNKLIEEIGEYINGDSREFKRYKI